MDVKVMTHQSDSGHTHVYIWNPNCERSINGTLLQIYKATRQPDAVLTLLEAVLLQGRVLHASRPKPPMWNALRKFFGTPADHDAAIQQLTEDGE